jgi:hypothetical protein
MDRPEVKAQQQEPDARKVLAGYAALNAQIGARVSVLHGVVDAAAGADEELAELAATLTAQRRFGMGKLAEELEARGALRPGLSVDEAADLLWLMSHPANYRWLVVTQGWSTERFVSWLADTLVAMLVDPAYRPPRHRSRTDRLR